MLRRWKYAEQVKVNAFLYRPKILSNIVKHFHVVALRVVAVKYEGVYYSLCHV